VGLILGSKPKSRLRQTWACTASNTICHGKVCKSLHLPWHHGPKGAFSSWPWCVTAQWVGKLQHCFQCAKRSLSLTMSICLDSFCPFYAWKKISSSPIHGPGWQFRHWLKTRTLDRTAVSLVSTTQSHDFKSVFFEPCHPSLKHLQNSLYNSMIWLVTENKIYATIIITYMHHLTSSRSSQHAWSATCTEAIQLLQCIWSARMTSTNEENGRIRNHKQGTRRKLLNRWIPFTLYCYCIQLFPCTASYSHIYYIVSP
jgi:hypothetical protein